MDSGVFVGGYYFKFFAADASGYLYVPRPSTSFSNIYISGTLINEGSAPAASVMLNLDNINIYPSFTSASSAGNMVTSYQRIEYIIISRDQTARMWKITVANNGNASTVMAVEYYGIP